MLFVRCTNESFLILFYTNCRDNELSTNRGNYLLIHLLKVRFPNIFQTEQIERATQMLSEPLEKSMLFTERFVCCSSIELMLKILFASLQQGT